MRDRKFYCAICGSETRPGPVRGRVCPDPFSRGCGESIYINTRAGVKFHREADEEARGLSAFAEMRARLSHC